MKRLDPALRSVVVLAALAAAGFVSVVVAAIAMARYDGVAIQLPYAVSGGMGGLGMLGFCLGIAAIQMSRRAAAADRRAFDVLLRQSADWLADLRTEAKAK